MDNLDSLILQNDERHSTLKNIESNSESQLILSDKISESVKELNKNTELLLLQGDKPKVQQVELKGVSLITIKGNKGDKGDTGESPSVTELQELIIPLIPEPIKGDKGDRGEIGKKGDSGKNGINGINGKNGNDGINGVDGKQGAKGPKGDKGQNGKDVDEEKIEELEAKINFAVNKSSKTVSLKELDDVNLGGLTQTNGKYNLGSGVGPSLALKTNNVNNGSQSILNLKAGTNVSLADDGVGGVIINSVSGAGVTDGDKGDITVSAAGAVWTIDNEAVTYAKIQNVTGQRILGRGGANGVVQELQLGAGMGIGGGFVGLNDIPANTLFGNNTAVVNSPAPLTVTQVKTLLAINNVDNTADINKLVSNPTQTALNLKANLVSPVFTGNVTVPTPSATTDATNKIYVDTAISSATVGLLDDRGNYDASSNLFPSTGGSGTSGAILKGDLWTVSVAGVIGGVAVTQGDIIRALVDSPAQTSTNWALTENNFGYVAENVINKATSFATLNNTLYPTTQAVSTEMNTRDTANRNRVNHTGTQLASTISDFATTVLSTLLTSISFVVSTAVTATDSILVAIGKLQAQITSLVNSKQNNITLTTTGTSGPATFTSNTLNIPNYATGGSSSLTWEKLTLNWSTEPTEIATIASGTVLSYTLLGITRYRLVPTIYNPTQDAFYANFDGVTLTNLIVARG